MDGDIIRGKADEEHIPGGLFCPMGSPGLTLASLSMILLEVNWLPVGSTDGT